MKNNYTYTLSDRAALDVRLVGSKAANLARLLQAGFPVPVGFVVTAAAFEQFLAANELDFASATEENITGARFPEDIEGALQNEFSLLGDISVAVRSSGIAEDLPGASFAGQYETVLDVRDIDALFVAVKRCWSSAFGKRVIAYKKVHRHGGAPRMAVLVQQLVRADSAGVAFTANPVTGDRDETVVSAVRGLGERLVSGQASPDEWTVKDGKAVRQRGPEEAITAEQTKSVADLAKRAEALFGNPQDIEWAIANGKVFLLQSRPITTLFKQTIFSVPIKPPIGFWQREGSHYPYPLSPMFRILLEAFNASIKRAAADFSLLTEGIEFREIGGWVYQRMVPLGGKDMPFTPPAWLMPLLIRIVPQMRSQIKGATEVIRSDKAGSYIDRWHTEWKPELITDIAKLRNVDLEGLSDEGLDRHIGEISAFFGRSLDIHTCLNFAVLIALADIGFVCRDTLGWDERKVFDLLSGLSEKSSEPARRLAQLAQMARARPAIRNLLGQIDTDTVQRLADADKAFKNAFSSYQKEYGARALRVDIADETMAESPLLILRLIRDQLIRDYDPAAHSAALEQKRLATVAEARNLLAGRPVEEQEHFEKAFKRGERAYPIREDNQFYTVSFPTALLRYAVLELGRRLADRKQIERRDDVFFFELEEARKVLRTTDDLRSFVERRKGERAWVEAHPGPVSYGKNPGPPPSMKALPPEARFLMEGLLWAVNLVFAADHAGHKQTSGKNLHGIAASPGRYIGPARIIMNESEFDKIQPGDVLVCPITSPVWSVLFPSVGALVTDTGGILSHPAIIAREYCVPAVVSTTNGTTVLRDGQKITVDGSAGLVEV